MRVWFSQESGSYLVLHCTGLIQQPPSCNINNGGSRAVPAAAASRGEGRAHRWCWDGPARYKHAAQQRIQRKRRAFQEIQVTSSFLLWHIINKITNNGIKWYSEYCMYCTIAQLTESMPAHVIDNTSKKCWFGCFIIFKIPVRAGVCVSLPGIPWSLPLTDHL